MHWRRFLDGARRNAVLEETARKIFPKINGYYMFPESHSQAFAATAYQTAWLKRYDQPMGFYPMETLKQDARRFGTSSLYPA